jgi:hypothetical protein
LRPPLKGFRRSSAGFVAISPNHDQTLTCQTLGIELKLVGGALVLIDAETRETLLTGEEAERAGREAERAAREAERAAREAERAGREAAEREVAKLRAELDALRKRVGDQSME